MKKLKLKDVEVETIKSNESTISKIKADLRKQFDFPTNEDIEFLSTGIAAVNYAISGKLDGGFPVGRITEIAGLNSTGKSLLAQHALIETQKKGGIAVLVDSEFAFQPDWYEKLGGDVESLIHYEPDYIEQAYQFIDTLVKKARSVDKDVPITVVYDSIAASPSKYEFENDMEKHDMGKRAIAHGKGIRLITGLCKKENITFIGINQYRATMAMFGPEMDTVGGQGWKYHASVRIDMKKGKAIKKKTEIGEKIIGIAGRLKVVKNRIRSPFAEASFNIYWDKGIDPVSGLFDVLVEEEVIKPKTNDEGKISKGWWTYKDVNFRESEFESLIEKFPELAGGHDLIDLSSEGEIFIEDFDEDSDDVEDADF